MNKWAWVAGTSDAREYTLQDQLGNDIDETHINYVHNGELVKTEVAPFYLIEDKTGDPITYVRLIKLVDVKTNKEYYVHCNNIFYESANDCIKYRLEGLENLGKSGNKISSNWRYGMAGPGLEEMNEIESEIKITKLVKRKQQLNDILND